jgi:sugar (pentulose or hexulose) kinase
MTEVELAQARVIAARWKAEEGGEFALVGGIGLLMNALLERGDHFEQLARERKASIETLRENLNAERKRVERLREALAAWQSGLGPQYGNVDTGNGIGRKI